MWPLTSTWPFFRLQSLLTPLLIHLIFYILWTFYWSNIHTKCSPRLTHTSCRNRKCTLVKTAWVQILPSYFPATSQLLHLFTICKMLRLYIKRKLKLMHAEIRTHQEQIYQLNRFTRNRLISLTDCHLFRKNYHLASLPYKIQFSNVNMKRPLRVTNTTRINQPQQIL